MIKCVCKICSKEFYTIPSRIKIGRGKYCSHKCRLKGLHNSNKGVNNWHWKNKIKRVCQFCKKEFFVLQTRINDNRAKFCSLKCKYSFGHTLESRNKISENQIGRIAWNKGKKCPQWSGNKNSQYKDKTIDKDGYILFYNPEHPLSCGSNKNYVREHRLVMEKHLGRYLTPKEVVHHINENKQDNRIENLVLFPNHIIHGLYHSHKKYLNWEKSNPTHI